MLHGADILEQLLRVCARLKADKSQHSRVVQTGRAVKPDSPLCLQTAERIKGFGILFPDLDNVFTEVRSRQPKKGQTFLIRPFGVKRLCSGC